MCGVAPRLDKSPRRTTTLSLSAAFLLLEGPTHAFPNALFEPAYTDKRPSRAGKKLISVRTFALCLTPTARKRANPYQVKVTQAMFEGRSLACNSDFGRQQNRLHEGAGACVRHWTCALLL
ncbi:unnamed protein product [Mesocestoides corti]|uniref:Secreted protein n=1 Tax=Mesocestoides corti TaxID=53468 RepID=A0A0R3UHL1_MESCO|nr:unnamed protein product [Mesocestoides corti]